MNNPEIIVKNAPFKHFCMSIGAIPTSYKDSLDYYETLLYLIKYLEETVIPVVNNNGEAVSELQRLYIELKNFVDNYFANLDVQEEINNKLDDMVESGELTLLIKNYVDPIYEAYEEEINANIDNQNNRISTIENQLQSVASGSPAGVYPTLSDLQAADPDHSKIYVVSADGKWYYYDTSSSSWLAGGDYQTSESSDTVLLIENKIDNSNINFYNSSLSSTGYLTSSGISSSSSYYHAEVEINPNTTYYLYRKSQIYSNTGDYFGFRDSENTLFDITVFGKNIKFINGLKYVEIKVPANALKLVFNTKLSGFDEIDTSILGTNNIITQFTGYDNDLRNYIDSFNNNFSLNLLNKEFINNYFVNNANNTLQITNTNNTKLAKTNVTAGKTYYLYRKSQVYNTSNDVIAYGNTLTDLSSYELLSSLEKVTLLNGEKCLKFTVPENMTHVYFNIQLTTRYNDTNTTILADKPTEYEILANDNSLRNYVENTILINNQPALKNRLRNKSWCLLGDSITAETFRSDKNYFEYISERTGILTTNMGVSGKGYVNGYETNTSMCDYVDTLTGEELFDYITIFAGTNDRNFEIGNINSTSKETVYGAIKYCVTELISKFPNKKIALLTPLPRSTNYGTNSNNALYKITKAIKEVGEYYSIPVLDLYIKSGLRPWNDTNNATFFSCEEAPNGDGLHPNALGHEWISYPIQQFLQLL